jgi:myo-inositol 2-dehydrogenase/D-chiro-inositol 1-dehydrogenase
MQTLGIALMGTGRMAHVYGPKINAHPGLRLEVVYNPRIASARKAAELYGGRPMDDLDQVLADPDVDAVVIATPTDTHVEYIEQAARAGKPIYCEKPLDQSLKRVDRAMTALENHPVPFMLGFNRRFDPDNASLREAVKNGEIGRLNMLMSWSREPSPPPIDYVRASGGYFVDATIHDIDLLVLDCRGTPGRGAGRRVLHVRCADRCRGRFRHDHDDIENAVWRTGPHQQFARLRIWL